MQESSGVKIIHCIDHYMPQHMAGTEVYVHTLATQQKMSGHQASVLIPHFEYYRPGEYLEHYQYDGIDVYQYLEISQPLNRDILSGVEKPAGLENFRTFLLSAQPDVVHFHELTRSIGLGVGHVRIARNLGVKVILTMHLSGYTCNTNTLINHDRLCPGLIREFECSVCSYKTKFNLPSVAAYPAAASGVLAARMGLTRKLPQGRLTTLLSFPLSIRRIRTELEELTENVDHLVSLTEWYKKILVSNGVPPEKITIISQALAMGHTPNPQKKIPRPGLPLKLVFIGRIQPQKGVDLLIEAAKDFTAAELQVDLYGKEEGTEYYRRCITALASLDTVAFRGAVKREQVLDTLAGYDILCLPSAFSEMSSLVIQEAFAAGIPVLASRVYGNIEQISDGHNGLLFDFKSSKDLRAKLKMLIKEPGLLQKLKGNVRPPGSFESISSAYLQLYTQKDDIS